MKCCVLTCRNNSANKPPGISFHRFPKDESRRKLWIESIGRSDLKITANTNVCSDHFFEKDLACLANKVRLSDTAFPVLKLNLPSEQNINEAEEPKEVEEPEEVEMNLLCIPDIYLNIIKCEGQCMDNHSKNVPGNAAAFHYHSNEDQHMEEQFEDRLPASQITIRPEMSGDKEVEPGILCTTRFNVNQSSMTKERLDTYLSTGQFGDKSMADPSKNVSGKVAAFYHYSNEDQLIVKCNENIHNEQNHSLIFCPNVPTAVPRNVDNPPAAQKISKANMQRRSGNFICAYTDWLDKSRQVYSKSNLSSKSLSQSKKTNV